MQSHFGTTDRNYTGLGRSNEPASGAKYLAADIATRPDPQQANGFETSANLQGGDPQVLTRCAEMIHSARHEHDVYDRKSGWLPWDWRVGIGRSSRSGTHWHYETSLLQGSAWLFAARLAASRHKHTRCLRPGLKSAARRRELKEPTSGPGTGLCCAGANKRRVCLRKLQGVSISNEQNSLPSWIAFRPSKFRVASSRRPRIIWCALGCPGFERFCCELRLRLC
jgi:hypothetical protein